MEMVWGRDVSYFTFQGSTVETRYNKSFGRGHFVCYIRYFAISVSVVDKQYKTKQMYSLGLENIVSNIRHFISDLFTWSFHCIDDISSILES